MAIKIIHDETLSSSDHTGNQQCKKNNQESCSSSDGQCNDKDWSCIF